MLLAAAVVLLPGTVGAAPAASTVLTAPFGVGVITTSNLTTLTHCSNASVRPAPHFSLHRGVGGFGDRATAWSCPALANHGIAGVSVTVALPIRFAVGGSHQIVLNVSVQAQQVERLITGNCTLQPNLYSYCDLRADQTLTASAQLVDLNNGSVFSSSNVWSEENYTDWDNFSTANGGYQLLTAQVQTGTFGAFPLYINGSFRAHHQYTLEVELVGASDARILTFQSTLTGASIAIYQNVDTLGNGETLNSITIT